LLISQIGTRNILMIKNSALLALIALNGTSGFVSIAPRTTGRLTTSFSSNIRSCPLFAVLVEQETETETEVGRLKTMAAKLRAEAASLEEEQAHKHAALELAKRANRFGYARRRLSRARKLSGQIIVLT
jgi:hypothetical protein